MNFRQGDTTGNQGLFWLKKILSLNPDTQIILLTAYADIHVAVESIKEGAFRNIHGRVTSGNCNMRWKGR